MAMARKCDRCGGYYEEYNRKKRFVDPVNAVAFVSRHRDGGWTGDKRDSFDLCPNCLEAVANFVRGEEKPE